MSVSRSLWNEEAFPLLQPAHYCGRCRRAVGDLGGGAGQSLCIPPFRFSSGLSALGETPRELRLGLLNFLGYSALDA